MNTDILSQEPASIYHAKAKSFLSSHQLIDFMRSPLLYWKKRSGLISEIESAAYFVGRAAHTRILEGRDVYEREYAIGGPINPATGKPFGATTKKFLEWQEEQKKPVIPFDKAELIENMHSGVRQNPYASELLAHGTAEGVVRTNYCNTPCQIRIDWFNPDHGIVDLKTCDDLTWFENDARKFDYAKQMAFYQSVLDTAHGISPSADNQTPVYIVAVEKKEPFRCGVWQVVRETLTHARHTNEAAISRLKLAESKDEWLTGFEELRYLAIA